MTLKAMYNNIISDLHEYGIGDKRALRFRKMFLDNYKGQVEAIEDFHVQFNDDGQLLFIYQIEGKNKIKVV